MVGNSLYLVIAIVHVFDVFPYSWDLRQAYLLEAFHSSTLGHFDSDFYHKAEMRRRFQKSRRMSPSYGTAISREHRWHLNLMPLSAPNGFTKLTLHAGHLNVSTLWPQCLQSFAALATRSAQ